MLDDAEWYATLDRIRAKAARVLNAECREYGLTLAQVAALAVVVLPAPGEADHSELDAYLCASTLPPRECAV